MMFDNDPQTQAMIDYHQESLLRDVMRNRLARTPSPFRVAIGLMLIRMGEQMRGRTQSTMGDTAAPIPVSRLHPAHQG